MIAPRVVQAQDVELTAEQELISESEEGATEYLLTSWFYRAMEAIRETRIANGLTQDAVARALGTSQSVVARLENAHRGNFSLDRFLRYAWASGAAPLDFEHVSPQVLRHVAVRNPAAPRTIDTVRIFHLADVLRLGPVKVDADVRFEWTGGAPQTYRFEFDSFPPTGAGNAMARRETQPHDVQPTLPGGRSSMEGGVPPIASSEGHQRGASPSPAAQTAA